MRALAVLLLVSACAAPVPWVRPVVDDVRARSYPELSTTPIAVGTETAALVGGRAIFAPGAIVGVGARDYEVRFSPELVDHEAGDLAIRYVVAHELAHLLDYERHSGGLWTILLEVLEDEVALERRADVTVVERGYVEELVAYRRWQRARLRAHPDLLADKVRNYFTPNEARAADEVRRRCPEVFARFRSDPPRNMREILTRCP